MILRVKLSFIKFLFLAFALTVNAAHSKRFQYKELNAITPEQRTAVPGDHKSNLSSSTSKDKESKILRNDVEVKGDGTYHYDFETSNGIKRTEQGAIDGTIQGSSSYISPEGIEIKTSYVADETGYHPVGDHIPKVPDYIVRALEYIRTHPYIEKDYYTGEVKQTAPTHNKPIADTENKSANKKSNKKSSHSPKNISRL